MFSIISLLVGLFPGVLAGANDTSALLGPASGSRMVPAKSMAVCCACLVVLGALVAGDASSQTLESLNALMTPAGAIIVSLVVALISVPLTRAGCPLATVQVVAAALLGIRLGSGSTVDSIVVSTLLLSWVASPLCTAVAALLIYRCLAWLTRSLHVNIFKLDRMIRAGIFFFVALGAFLLGANNLPALMGYLHFLNSFTDHLYWGTVHVSAVRQLYILGGIALISGLWFYGRTTMVKFTAEHLYNLSFAPLMALVALMAQCFTLWIFTFPDMGNMLAGYGLFRIPLVPISGSQCLVGAIMALSFINPRVAMSGRSLTGILACWIAVPVCAGGISFALACMVL